MKRQHMSLIIGMAVAIAGLIGGISPPGWALAPVNLPGYTPDYFQTPNWANSPALTKFVDPLPVLWDPLHPNPATAPAKCMTLAVPDTRTYPGSDYYEIELQEYTEVMHSEMPGGTRLRGFVQVNNGTNLAGNANTVAPAPIRYAGPLIVATKNRPVRVKFTNALNPASKLFLPIDTTLMGSGTYTINYDPQTNLTANLSPALSPITAGLSIFMAAARRGSAMEHPISGSRRPERRIPIPRAPACPMCRICGLTPAEIRSLLAPVLRHARLQALQTTPAKDHRRIIIQISKAPG
jgi:hypothetical protein